MIIILKQDAPEAQVREFCHELTGMGFEINDSVGSDTHILGLIGDTKALSESWVLANPVVDTCRRVSEPYKKANRKFHPDDTVVEVGGTNWMRAATMPLVKSVTATVKSPCARAQACTAAL